MPRFNGTGPRGMGTKTGRGLGPCGKGRAFGCGQGLGRGFQNKIKKENNMKIAISSIDKNIESNVSNIFGRCPYFIVTQVKDNKIGEIEIIENKNINQTSGAGVSTAQLMAEKDINVIITGDVGPRALDVLNQFNIEIYSEKGVIKDVLQQFIDGKLKKIN